MKPTSQKEIAFFNMQQSCDFIPASSILYNSPFILLSFSVFGFSSSIFRFFQVSPSMDRFRGQPRLPKFAVPKRYDISLKPDLCLCKFSGSVAIDIDILSDTRFLVLNAADLHVHDASVSFTNRNSSKVLNRSLLLS